MTNTTRTSPCIIWSNQEVITSYLSYIRTLFESIDNENIITMLKQFLTDAPAGKYAFFRIHNIQIDGKLLTIEYGIVENQAHFMILRGIDRRGQKLDFELLKTDPINYAKSILYGLQAISENINISLPSIEGKDIFIEKDKNNNVLILKKL